MKKEVLTQNVANVRLEEIKQNIISGKDELMTFADVVRFLNKSVSTVKRWEKTGKLKRVGQIQKSIYFLKSDVLEFLLKS